MVSEQDLCSRIKCSKMSNGNIHFVPSATSGIYDSQEIPLIHDFPEYAGHLNIEKFFNGF